MGRPVKTDRKSIGFARCPICGKKVEVWEGFRGTAYSNHDGHGFKMSKKQIEDFLNSQAQEQREAAERVTPKAPEQVTPPPEFQEDVAIVKLEKKDDAVKLHGILSYFLGE